jgi:aromatic-amino-acid transaminase
MTDKFNADPDPRKANLGVGVYLGEDGKVPLMAAVAAVEKDIPALGAAHPYLPMSGSPDLTKAIQELVFGANSEALQAGRVASLQTLAGTGALRIGAGLLALTSADATVMMSDPTWENHESIFGRAGFKLGHYRYYNPELRGIDFAGLLEDLGNAASGSIVLLHACCHNPTGYDLTPAQWDEVVTICVARELVPFLDMAYQGFSVGIREDAAGIEKFANSGLPFLVANSFSKTFGLYGERVGGISYVTTDADEAERVMSQAKMVVRSIYSNPPTYGAKIVSTILATPELKALWEQELYGYRDRIKAMRSALRSGLEAAGVPGDFSYITSQAGMFSYSGLDVEQMQRLRSQFHVYGLDSGRMCMAGLNTRNIDWVVGAIASVIEG